jgi:hypothetical protein
MTNKNIFSKGRLFSTNAVNRIVNAKSVISKETAASLSGTNISSKNSFRYDNPGAALRSTQQLPVSFAEFENHTFFNSAEAKTNLAFDLIINNFPFDGSRSEVEEFLDDLTGFEKYVYDSFPKHHGYLHFSGSEQGDTSEGTYIKVDDFAGLLIPALSKTKTAKNKIDPKSKSLSIEFNMYVPQEANDIQAIFQKISGSNNGFTLGLDYSDSLTSASLIFTVASASAYMNVSTNVDKGSFSHLCAVFDRDSSANVLKIYSGSNLVATSSNKQVINNIAFSNSQFLIGSGTTQQIDNAGTTFDPQQTFSGALDDVRVFNSARTPTQLAAHAKKTLYPSDDLRLLMRFNEPTGSYTSNDIVLDSSGNSLHATITNFGVSARLPVPTPAGDVPTPMTLETIKYSPVLFPDFNGVTTLNTDLLQSASLYDLNNPNIITKLIPRHYLLEGKVFEGLDNIDGTSGDAYSYEGTDAIPGSGKIGSAQLISSFLYVWAKQFDEVKMFIDHFSNITHVDYTGDDSVADTFLPFLANYYGFDLPSLYTLASAEQYNDGVNVLKDASVLSNSLKFIQNSMWRQILTNMNEFVKTKGTVHSIKAFLRSAGINPDKIFRFKEYGGSRTKRIDNARVKRTEIAALLDFSGSLVPVVQSLGDYGIPTNKPFIQSAFLSGSRLEVGFPEPAGDFVYLNDFKPNGISNNASDGLYTSGSWTYEATYKFPSRQTGSYSATQSLMRLNVTGASAPTSTHGVLFNLVALSGTSEGRVKLFGRPSGNITSPTLELEVTGVNIVDGDRWHISFGRNRNDSFDSTLSSSYFLRVGSEVNGDITSYHNTSTLYYERAANSQVLESISAQVNSSGPFITIGSQSLNSAVNIMLNSAAVIPNVEARATEFAGKVGQIRFWSKALSVEADKEHIRNFRSVGIEDPLTNFNFVQSATGSFEKLRLDVSADQPTTTSNASGAVTLVDFSQNNSAFAGSGFDTSARIIKPERFDYTLLDPKFDETTNDNKVRIRGFKDEKNITEFGGQTSPVYDVVRSEEAKDDTRFSIDISSIQALNEDIITIFSTLDAIDNILGKPENQYSLEYHDLRNLREVYFNKLTDKINLATFFDFFKWFDTSYSSFIEKMIPSKTNYLGINYIIESHMLERNKATFNNEDIYLGEGSRLSSKGQILLRNFNIKIKKY